MSDDGFRYRKVSGGYEVACRKNRWNPRVAVPSEHEGEPVVAIARDGFRDRDGIVGVSVPDTVTRIGDGAFAGCVGLRKVSGMKGVRRIGARAFFGCVSLTRLTVPAGCGCVGSDAFSGCSRLVEVRNLSPLDLSASGTGLKAANVYADRAGAGVFFKTGDGFAWYRFRTEDGGMRCVLTGYGGKEENLVLPATCEGMPYEVGGRAFEGCVRLGSVEIPSGLRRIGERAFYGCDSIGEVRVESLSDWLGIRFDTVDANPLFCGRGVLIAGGKPVTCLEVPSGTVEIGDFAFAGGLFSSVGIPDGVTRIGNGAFFSCYSVMTVTLPESLLSIGDDAFRGCDRLLEVMNLSALRIRPGDGAYGCVALRAKAVKTSTDESGAFFTDGEGYCFYDSGDGLYLYGYDGDGESLTLPEAGGRTYEICDEAFVLCHAADAALPPCVSSVGREAFSNCHNLRHVSVQGASRIGDGAFADCGALERVELGSGLTLLGAFAFQGCFSLSDVRLPEGLASIGDGAFYGCESLDRVVVPGTVSHIGYGAFRTADENGFMPGIDVFLLSDPSGIRPGPGEWRKSFIWEADLGYSSDAVEEPMTVWLYSAERPGIPGRFWHYDGAGNPVKW